MMMDCANFIWNIENKMYLLVLCLDWYFTWVKLLLLTISFQSDIVFIVVDGGRTKIHHINMPLQPFLPKYPMAFVQKPAMSW